jgi:hypothetical protein
MKVVMRGTLAQVWGLISGMQLVVHMPLFNVEMPDSTMSLFSELIKIATFDLPYVNVEEIFGQESLPESEKIFTYEEDEDFEFVLQELGYESHYMAVIMGSIYIFMLGSFVGLLLILLLYPFITKFGWAKRLQNWLKGQLIWNFMIRLYLMSSLELSFAIVLNIPFFPRISDTNHFFEALDYIISI